MLDKNELSITEVTSFVYFAVSYLIRSIDYFIPYFLHLLSSARYSSNSDDKEQSKLLLQLLSNEIRAYIEETDIITCPTTSHGTQTFVPH